MLTFNATQAYLESHPGVQWSTANTQGSALLKDRRVASEVKARTAKASARYRRDGLAVLDELASVAFSNVRDAYDEKGQLLPIRDMPVRVTAAIKKVKQRVIMSKKDEETGAELNITVVELEMSDKLGPLRLLGLENGLFVEKIEHNAGVGFAEALRAARERVGE